MTRIGTSDALSAHLRTQLREVSSALRLGVAASSNAASEAKQTAVQSQRDAGKREGTLAATVARRVAAIDRSDPERRRRAFRVFLESLLLDEWGEDLINDPTFYQLVDSVQRQMESRADLCALMDTAADQLLDTSPD